MPHWRRAPLTIVTGVGLVVSGVACTDGPQSEEAEESPRPLPTVYDAQLPPGVSGKPLRFLHGPESEGPGILDDANGVRIESLGNAFLFSSNSEERHVLQRAGDGEKLWEGAHRVSGFGRDRDGSEVLILSEDDDGSRTTVVLDDEGETVWRGADREIYLDGLVLRRPEEWSADDPYGDFAVLDTDGEEIWDFTFEEPEDAAEEESEEDAEDDPDDTPDLDRMGVPVGAQGDVLFLHDGAGLLQARDAGDAPGELLWGIAGDDEELAGGSAVPRPRPQLVGGYELPAGEEDSADGAEDEGGGAEETRTTVLVRWSHPEEPSRLSLHDLESGELVWSLVEPGVNPADHGFNTVRVPGTVYDSATHTLLLPQASRETPMIGIDLVEGEVGWRFDDETERSISPAFSLDGHIYGSSRDADDGTSQVVLEAETKKPVADDLTSYVEAVTDDGHAIVVWDRQRFVFGPEEEQEEGGRPSYGVGAARPHPGRPHREVGPEECGVLPAESTICGPTDALGERRSLPSRNMNMPENGAAGPEPPELPLASEFPQATQEQWRELVAGVLRKTGGDTGQAESEPEELLASATYEGIRISPCTWGTRASTPAFPGWSPSRAAGGPRGC